MKKYVVHPGKVKSKNDGEIHFVGFGELCRLYKVNPQECFNADRRRIAFRLRDEWPDNLIHLFPDLNGTYVLPR